MQSIVLERDVLLYMGIKYLHRRCSIDTRAPGGKEQQRFDAGLALKHERMNNCSGVDRPCENLDLSVGEERLRGQEGGIIIR